MVVLLGANHFCYAQSIDEQQVRSVLQRQTEAWNRGDLDGFMQGYWPSDSLLFVGKSGPQRGYQTTLQNYRKGYPDTSAMGQLTFDLLELRPLSANHYFVLGRWSLVRTIGNVEGYFTLLFKKIKGKWLIISDHSS